MRVEAASTAACWEMFFTTLAPWLAWALQTTVDLQWGTNRDDVRCDAQDGQMDHNHLHAMTPSCTQS